MNKYSPKILGIVFGGLVLIGVCLTFLISGIGPDPRVGHRASSSDAAAPPAVPGGGLEPSRSEGDALSRPAVQPVNQRPGLPSGDDRIYAILADQKLSPKEAASEFMRLAGDLGGTVDGRIAALSHGLTLLVDENYRRDGFPLIIRTDLPEEMNEILLADLHNRQSAVIVDAATKIAAIPGHPKAGEARKLADFFREATGVATE